MANYMNFEYINESSIDPELICGICNVPFNDPLCTPCDHTFCGQCITDSVNTGITGCPICRRQLSINSLTPASRVVRNMLDRLLVSCVFCGKTGLQRGTFKEHMDKDCSKVHVSCPSADINCLWKGPRDQLNSHETTCVFQPFRSILIELMTKNRQLEEQIKQQNAEIKELSAQTKQQDEKSKQQNTMINTSISQVTSK